MMPPSEGPALVVPRPELSSGVGTNVAVMCSRLVVRSSQGLEGKSLLAEAHQDIQVPSCSGLFLRRGGDVAILSEESILDGLEEFEKFPLREMKEAMENV